MKMKKIVVIALSAMLLMGNLIWGAASSLAASNLVSSIDWRDPWIHVPFKDDFAYKNFAPQRSGFEIFIEKSDPSKCIYGIQVISHSYVKLAPGKYLLKFNAVTGQKGPIFFNIQSDNSYDPGFVLSSDKRWIIDPAATKGGFRTCEHEFTVEKKSMGLLHFKIGALPAKTFLKVENIHLEKID